MNSDHTPQSKQKDGVHFSHHQEDDAPQGPNKLVVPILALIGGILLFGYLMMRPEPKPSNLVTSSGESEADLEKSADSYDIGTFHAYVPGDDPELSLDDLAGSLLTFSCADGCPPIDQAPERFVGQKIKVYWMGPSALGEDSGDTPTVKVVVKIEILSGK